jgi:hypothetical protein
MLLMRPGGPAQDGEEEDALDAFMAAEILPEVTAAQQAERAAKEQERLERAKALAVRPAPPSEQASSPLSRLPVCSSVFICCSHEHWHGIWVLLQSCWRNAAH